MPLAMRRFFGAPLVALSPFAFALAFQVSGCTRPEPPPPPPPPPPAKVDEDILARAFYECFTGDCERAYAHLSEVAADSPVRKSDRYRAVLYRHDADRILRADDERDEAKRRAIFESISNSYASELSLRLMATERLARLGSATLAGASEVVLNALPDAASPASLAAQDSAELLRMSQSKDPAELKQVRAKLEPKIFAGKAKAEDVAMLRTVCKAQKDATCVKQLERLILP